FFFFFQAEDGIRDGHVTGVQTCALPILASLPLQLRVTGFRYQPFASAERVAAAVATVGAVASILTVFVVMVVVPPSLVAVQVRRSEERRVGKEGRSGGAGGYYNKSHVVT